MGLNNIDVYFDISFLLTVFTTSVLLILLLKLSLEKRIRDAVLTGAIGALVNALGIALHEAAHFFTARALNIEVTQLVFSTTLHL